MNRARIGLLDHNAAIPRARFEIAIIRDFLHEIRQIERRRSAPIHPAIDPCQRQQLTDERVQPVRLQRDTVQVLRGFFGGTLLHTLLHKT